MAYLELPGKVMDFDGDGEWPPSKRVLIHALLGSSDDYHC